MKGFLFAVLLVGGVSMCAQVPTAYDLTVRVVGTKSGQDCTVMRGESVCEKVQTLQVIIAGRKFELQSAGLRLSGLVALGDYKARLAESKAKPTGEYEREYTLQFPDGSTRNFQVIAERE